MGWRRNNFKKGSPSKQKRQSYVRDQEQDISILSDTNRMVDKECFSKKRYHDEDEAKRIINKLKGKRGVSLRYYFCDICKGYHLTSKDVEEEKFSFEPSNLDKKKSYDDEDYHDDEGWE